MLAADLDKIEWRDRSLLLLQRRQSNLYAPLVNAAVAMFTDETRASIEQHLDAVLEQTVTDWQQWMMREFEQYPSRTSGNDRVNLLMAWQGGARQKYFSVASTGFITPDQWQALGMGVTDPGWYGRGLYFTQLPR